MRAACWGSGLDSSPLLRLACLQAGRRQHCQPRQVRKKAAVTAAAGCPAHKSRERGNVRGFLRLQQALWARRFFWGEGSPLISAVDARKAPSSLTGTALLASIRSLLAREGPSPHPLPGALYRNAGAGASRDTAWWPLRSGIRPEAPRQAPALSRPRSPALAHAFKPPAKSREQPPKSPHEGKQPVLQKNIHHPHKIPPRTASPKNKKALPEDRQGQQDLHVTTAVGDLNKRFWKGGRIGGRENLFPADCKLKRNTGLA